MTEIFDILQITEILGVARRQKTFPRIKVPLDIFLGSMATQQSGVLTSRWKALKVFKKDF